MTAERNKKTVYRDSIDGKFITKKEADKRPSTTEKQNLKPSTRNRQLSKRRTV